MLKRLICQCGFELKSPTYFCPNCGKKHAIACGIFPADEKVYVLVIGDIGDEVLTFKRYDEEESIKNLYELIAEKLYDRRVDEIVISGKSEELRSEAFEYLRDFIYPFKLTMTDIFDESSEFFSKLQKFAKVKRNIKTVDTRPEDKIHGAHSTIIGGREGYSLILKIARSPYVKKIVPGVIESSGVAAGGGVRLKMTRCDDKGNIKALLIDGATVQQIHVITTASNKEEGEIILKILKGQ